MPLRPSAIFTIAAILAAGAVRATPAEDPHIHAVETGLLPAIVVKGEPAPTMTLAARMKDLHVPGVSIAFFDNGRMVWARGYGFADVARRVHVTPDTRFQAGSISKSLAAMAALRLVQDGRLDLDADVNTRLTAWRVPASPAAAGQAVTLRRLLSHTAGLTVHGFEGYSRTAPRPTLAQVLSGEKPANSAPVVVNLEPGTKWVYSGGGFTVAQLLMQEVSGLPFDQLMRRSVLDPIGLTASTYEQPLPPALQASAATAYRADGQPVAGGWNVYPEQAAAGLWTTPSDLARWAMELQNEYAGTSSKVLSQATAKTMLTAGLGDWGLGVSLPADGPARFAHGGANEGFRNDFVAFLGGSRQGVVVMTNSDSGGELISEIERSVAAAYDWPIDRPKALAVVPVAPEVLAAWAGSYRIEGLGRIEVAVRDGRLFVTATAVNPAPLEARTFAQDGFFVASPVIVGKVQKGADGSVASIALETAYGAFTARRISP